MFSKKSIASAIALPATTNIKALLHPKSNRVSLFCNLSETHGPSSTGKTITIASSGGNKPLGTSNASLGLNVFCKSVEELDLSDKAVGALTTLTELCPGLEWQVVEKHLHFLLDFDKTAPRTAKSEKSSLLMTSSGFKKVGTTGVSINLNCTSKVGTTFNPEGLKTFAEAASGIPDNMTVVLSKDGSSVLLTADLSDVPAGTNVSVPGAVIGEDLVLNFHIKKIAEVTSSTPRSPSKKKGEAPFVPLADGSNVSIRGAETNIIELSIPIEDLGFSSSGKTIIRGSSKGFKMHGNVHVNLSLYSKDIKPSLETIVAARIAAHANPGSLTIKELRDGVQEAMGVKELTDEHKTLIKDFARAQLASKRPRDEEAEE